MKISNTELGYLKSIEDSVDLFLKSKTQTPSSSHEMFRVTERALAHVVPDTRFHVTLSNRTDCAPFIMGVYPDAKELNAKAEVLLTLMEEGKQENFLKEWAAIKDWIVEIDARILTKGSPICVDDGAQFVAILCHEVGHVLGGNPLALVENYAKQKKMYSKAERMILSKNPLIRKCALPMFVCTSQFRIVAKNIGDGMNKEIRADHYIPDEYRESMITYMENHIINNPDKAIFITTKEEFDTEQKTSIAFSRECIRLMRHRRDALKNSIKQQYNKGGSKYMVDMASDIGREAMGYDPSTDSTNTVYENCALRQLNADVMECTAQATAILENASVTPRDISILSIQVDDINTVDQKLFVVHTIYDYLEILEAQKEKILKKYNGNSPEKATISQDAMIGQLNEILQRVMKIDVSNVGDRYGIFVKYPKGYEG